jgi:hypothetical protein
LKNQIRKMAKNQLILHGASPLIVGDGKNDVVVILFGDSRTSETLPLASSGGPVAAGVRSTITQATADRLIPAQSTSRPQAIGK